MNSRSIPASQAPDPPLSLARAQGRALTRSQDWMQHAGMTAGSTRSATSSAVCGRGPGRPDLMLGSHLDTVRDAGRYDGMFGVVTGHRGRRRADRAACACRSPSR